MTMASYTIALPLGGDEYIWYGILYIQQVNVKIFVYDIAPGGSYGGTTWP